MSYVTPDDVAQWADLELVGSDNTSMQSVIDAVESGVTSAHVWTPATPVPAAVKQATIMQCSRLWKRRNTPEGISTFGPDFAIRVNRFDPDIDALLAPFKDWTTIG